ncbi:MAG: TonB-dependent receptor plug domain-containing protein [Flavobacteriales bacterium]|nr:TonB-dependent receptor plug domain-containing protein [Flavobacteriales bacterium]
MAHCSLTTPPVAFSRVLLSFLVLAPLGLAAQSDTLLNAAQPDTSENKNRPQLPVFTLTTDDLDGELGNQDISGILQSSRDVFTSVAGFNFGQARFRIRGYDSENTLVSINGVLVNDFETGWASWSNWAGLNDVTRWMQVRTGIGASRVNFGSLGGATDMNIQASALRKGVRGSYASANRAYRNRLMFTYATGMNAKGWAFAFSGSRRWAEEGYVDGTSFNAFSYFLAAEKRLNERHTISLSGFGAPIMQGRQGIAVQEAYDLTDNSYYNPNWGYQNGEKRNAKMSHDHKPMILATHTFKVSDAAKLTTSAYYTFGRDGLTGLNWFDAKDPRPDYYRYLPSFYRFENAHLYDDRVAAWQNENTRQIDWDQLYFANGKNLYSVVNANGDGSTITGNRSKYIVEEVRADPMRFGVNSVWTKTLSDATQLTFGGSMHKQRTHYFKVVDDLLGGDFWVDIDQFADRDFSDSTISLNDVSTPNKVVEIGDVFGWDYTIHTSYMDAFAQVEHKWGRMETYAGIDLSSTSFWRKGNVQNGRFPNNSLGDSDKNNFLGFGLKLGAIYKITGRHFVSANAAYISRPPAANASYLGPRVRDAVVPGLTQENAISGDISYIMRAPRLKGRATLYYTRIADQVWNRSYYHDVYLTIVNYAMTGVDQLHRGVELGVEANLTSTWVMTAVYAGGSYTYDSRPVATITRNNSNEVFGADRTIYWKGYRVGGMPQTAASLGLKYNSPKFWFAGFNANWFGDIYLDPNPDRRTAEALENLVTSDPQWDDLLEQTKLDDNYTLDLYAGKSWMLKRKYRIALNLTVSNVLDNQEFRVGGFEQLRYDRMNVDRFPPKYSYLFGRNYFAMVTFSF